MIILYSIVLVRRDLSFSRFYFKAQKYLLKDKSSYIHITRFCQLWYRISQGWVYGHVLYIYWNRNLWKIDISSSGADQILALMSSFSSSSAPILTSTHYRYSRPFTFVGRSYWRIPISGVLSAMSAMVNLEIPWINIMSKMDLVTENPDDPAGGARNGIRGRKNIARWAVIPVYQAVLRLLACLREGAISLAM
jgi:hypothetical protein